MMGGLTNDFYFHCDLWDIKFITLRSMHSGFDEHDESSEYLLEDWEKERISKNHLSLSKSWCLYMYRGHSLNMPYIMHILYVI